MDPLKIITCSDEYLYITNADTFYAWIEYNSNNKYFGVFVNQDIVKPTNLMLFGIMNLNDFFSKWNFTAFSKNPQSTIRFTLLLHHMWLILYWLLDCLLLLFGVAHVYTCSLVLSTLYGNGSIATKKPREASIMFIRFLGLS